MSIKEALIEHINNNHDDFILYQTNKLKEKNMGFHNYSCNLFKEGNLLSKVNSFKNYIIYFTVSIFWIKYRKMTNK